MINNEQQQNPMQSIKDDVVALRPDWDNLDINDPTHAFFLVFAAAALRACSYNLETVGDDGEIETIKISSLGSVSENLYPVAISSSKIGSSIPKKLATVAREMFAQLNEESI